MSRGILPKQEGASVVSAYCGAAGHLGEHSGETHGQGTENIAFAPEGVQLYLVLVRACVTAFNGKIFQTILNHSGGRPFFRCLMLETMDMNNDRLKALLSKYLDGAATEAEIQEVDDWYRSFEGHAGITEQLSAEERNALEQLLFLRISHRIAEASAAGKLVKAPFLYWWAAASIVVLMLAGGIYFASRQGARPDTALAAITAQADRSGIKKIALPDGTLIWLNFDSNVRYTQADNRELWLEGEGYFEVAPQQGKAFLVHAGKLDVAVLGTSFNIDAYTPGASITVTVSAGKVSVGNEQTTGIAICANQQAIYQNEGNKIDTTAINAADFNA